MRDLTPFSNRLSKNHRHLAKWAKRQDTECYRLYDRDIPEFPVIVDVYGASAHIQEVDTGWQIDEDSHAAWLDAIRQAVAEVLAIAVDDIALKTRRRQKGLAQYEKTGETGRERIVSETGRRFIVNLEAYLDTGLFLDHRNTRRVVGEHAAGKRFLNLFAYTGSFTVYAATGGAISSVTVDLSNTYQDWSRRNFELNGLDLSRHSLVRADVFRYLQDAAAAGERFDLIVMDPPSFSNSKKCSTSSTCNATSNAWWTAPWPCSPPAACCISLTTCAASSSTRHWPSAIGWKTSAPNRCRKIFATARFINAFG